MKSLAIALVAFSIGGCVVAPAPVRVVAPVGVVVPPGVVYVAPAYPAPGPGYHHRHHPRYGWGWYHADRGWHHGWR